MFEVHATQILHIRIRFIQTFLFNRSLYRDKLPSHYLFEVFLNNLFCGLELIHVNTEQRGNLLHYFLDFIFALLDGSLIARDLYHSLIGQSVIVFGYKNVGPCLLVQLSHSLSI